MYMHDMWLAPVTITTANNKFRVFEDGTTERIVTVSAGEYYLHADTAYNTAYPSLYLAIKTALEAVSAYEYDFSSQTPTGSGQQSNAGCKLTSDASALVVDFDDADFTMDPRWFGETSASLWTGDTEYTSQFTIYGTWYSNTIDVAGAASNKRRDLYRQITYSHDRPDDRYALEWYSNYTRRIVYEYVPAAHVFEVAANSSIYASVARLATSDTHNAWETIWSALSRGKSVLVCHDIGTTYSMIGLQNVDECLLRSEEQAQTLSSTATLMRSAGEMYMIDVDLHLVSVGYDH
jgi:hypothetical protein